MGILDVPGISLGKLKSDSMVRSLVSEASDKFGTVPAFLRPLIPHPLIVGVLPITAFVGRDGYSTSFILSNWLTAPTNTIWVSASRGNDTTGNGSYATPYAGFKKALTTIGTGVATTINVEGGYYHRGTGPNGTSADADINVFAWGDVVFSAAYEALTWSAHTVPGVYKTTRSTVAAVRDCTRIGSFGEEQELTNVPTLTLCEATPNSWYSDGTTLYVHRNDGVMPTNGAFISNTKVFAELDNGWISGVASGTKRRHVYSGIIFEGGRDGAYRSSGTLASAACEVIFDRCTFRYAACAPGNEGTRAPNGLSNVGLALCISHKCVAYANRADGFNHHLGPANAKDPRFVEIDCLSYGNGWNNGVENFNGFTSHEAARGLRVNCVAWWNIGPEFADIDNSASWNIGCKSLGTRATVQASQTSGFQSLASANQYNHDCIATGSANARYVGGGASMTWIGGKADGNSAGGGYLTVIS